MEKCGILNPVKFFECPAVQLHLDTVIKALRKALVKPEDIEWALEFSLD